MKVVIVTPLYPPEVAEPAPYAKELARRLSQGDSVSVVAYTHLPEQTPGVTVEAVDKRRPLPARLYAFTRALLKAMDRADVVYAINGSSVELPVLVASYVRRTPLIFCIADHAAHERARYAGLSRTLEHLAFVRARTIVTELPLKRPEILPLDPEPTEALAAYETSWATHLTSLRTLFDHATH